MPLFNTIGDPMPIRQLSDRERWISNLRWPYEEQSIFHLPPDEFKQWLYSRDPKEALLLTSTHGISTRIKRQLSWKRWSIVSDWCWRLVH